MTRLAVPLAALAGGFTILASCSTSTFGGSSNKAAAVTGTATGDGVGGTTPTSTSPLGASGSPTGSGTAPATGSGTGTGSTACVQGDTVNFDWSGPEKTCIVDQHMTYNFDTNQCAQMRPAQFTCDWATVQAQLTQRNLLTPTLKTAATSGALLVTCGESQDGSRIVVQWIDTPPPAGTCTYDPNQEHITTGCYTQYTGTPPPAPTTPAAQAAAVYACMNEL